MENSNEEIKLDPELFASQLEEAWKSLLLISRQLDLPDPIPGQPIDYVYSRILARLAERLTAPQPAVFG